MPQMMNNFSDEELMLLEMMHYIDENVYLAAGTEDIILANIEDDNLGEILDKITDEHLTNLRNYVNPEDGSNTIVNIEGSEWADVIEAIKANEKLCKLEIADVETFERSHAQCGSECHMPLLKNTPDMPVAICWVNPDEPEGNAYITFKGTSGNHDWYDNVMGLDLLGTDDVDGLLGTPRQKRMYDYVKSLDEYTNLTLVGHSKGGNYAQYIALEDDRVVRAISMDGQGLADEYIRANVYKIMRNSKKIKNYSVTTDFVNPLLYAVPGVEQVEV